VLDLDVSKLGETGHILLLDVLEAVAHLIHLVVKSPVVLLYVEQLLFSSALFL